MTVLWVGMSWGFFIGVGVSFGSLAIRIWWINRGRPTFGKWRMFGG